MLFELGLRREGYVFKAEGKKRKRFI